MVPDSVNGPIHWINAGLSTNTTTDMSGIESARPKMMAVDAERWAVHSTYLYVGVEILHGVYISPVTAMPVERGPAVS